MTQPRIDFYTKVHKGLRAALFELSARAATLDYADEQAVATLATQAGSLFARLAKHAEHEEHFVHPLLAAKLGPVAFDAAHAGFAAEEAALEAALQRVSSASRPERMARGLAFYRGLNAYIGRYLQHLDEEEAVMPRLWERCSDAELAEVMARFGASRPLSDALADLGWILPALSPAERAEMVNGLTSAWPAVRRTAEQGTMSR